MSALAVLTTESLPAAPDGHAYQAWVRHGDTWAPLGMLQPNADGAARVIAENAALAAPPEAVEIRLELEAVGQKPSGALILAWRKAA